jgi:hypothetical protein
MTKRKLQLLAVFLGVTAIACFTKGKEIAQPMNATVRGQTTQGVSLEIPDARWEPVFFESLDTRTKKAGISSLRKTVLPDNDLEARFWYDYAEEIQGLIIRRSRETWSATYLRERHDHGPSSIEQERLAVPKSGWESAWRRLTSAGLLTLPDGSSQDCESGVLDGIGYVVETNVNRKYRTYRYGNPQLAKCDDAKRILSIERILSEEFRLPRTAK